MFPRWTHLLPGKCQNKLTNMAAAKATEKAEKANALYHEIVARLAEAVIRQDPIAEIKDLIVDTNGYRNVLRGWSDPDTSLNILQIAIAVGHVEVVKLFSADKFVSVFGCTIWDERGDVLNPALHLACKVGALDLIRYYVEERHCDLTSKAVVTYGYSYTYDDTEGDVQEPELTIGSAGARKDESEDPQSEGACGTQTVNDNKDNTEVSGPCCVSLPLQTPYEVAVYEQHIHCANYLCEYIINNMDKPLHPLANSTLLHHSAYLGSADHIRLLLENGYDPYLNERDTTGHMPIHVAALTAEAECLRVLLQFGANLNARADHRSCLHIMYWSKFRPEKFYASTRVLIDYGINVNAMDHNNNTALDYLAWELGQKWYQISKAWITMHRVSEAYRYSYTNTGYEKPTMTDVQFRLEIFNCMELLLKSGASTLVRNRDGSVDHTIVHTLLQNTGWPLNCSLRQRPLEVYKALELLFQFGADPNVIARNNNESAMTMLLMHSLHEVPLDLKLKFVLLFIMNSADLECLIPEPKQYRENYSDRRWNVYPVMIALQERHPMPIVQMLYNFMSLPHVYRSLKMTADKFLWHRMTWTLGNSAAKEDKYRQEWRVIRRPRVRLLKHTCKLRILKKVKGKGQLTTRLPLPKAMISYLQAAEF